MNGQQQQHNPRNPQPQFKLSEGNGWGYKLSSWFKRNAPVVVPVLIIVVLAGLIYSYTQNTQITLEDLKELDNELVQEPQSENTTSVIGTSEESKQEEKAIKEAEKLENLSTSKSSKENTIVPTDQIAIVAQAGEGITHLARKALAQYLVTSPDSSLTKEHKIYIEDYMQDKTGNDRLEIGDERSFSIDLIQEAIAKSKTLTQNDLQNLTQYSQLVPSL